jgi:NADH-quinone oxidoreductase subunit I
MLLHIIQKMFRVARALRQPRLATQDVRHHAVHLSANYRGQHTVDHEACTGCDICADICPVNAITMLKLPFKRRNTVPEVNLATCIYCGLCEDVCPTKPEKAIKLSGGRFDILTGGSHADQESFWLRANIPQSYIDSRLAEEEAARVKKEMEAKKKEALAAEEARLAAEAEHAQPVASGAEGEKS